MAMPNLVFNEAEEDNFCLRRVVPLPWCPLFKDVQSGKACQDFRCTADLEVQNAGQYVFTLSSDDGAGPEVF